MKAGLESGLLAIGEDVVAVVSFTLDGFKDGGACLIADVTGRGIPNRALVEALRQVADDLEEKENYRASGAGAVHENTTNEGQ